MILPHRKSWTLNLETIILSSDGGNLHDVLTLAARSALYDMKIPRTRGVGYQDNRTLDNEELSGMKGLLKGGKAGKKNNEVDFELESYWDQGAPLEGREDLPVCVTLNVVSLSCLSLGVYGSVRSGRLGKNASSMRLCSKRKRSHVECW